MSRLNYKTLLIFLFLIIGVSSVSAITGNIINARIVLNSDVGQSVNGSLKIENVNNIPITVELITSGDLATSLKLNQTSFTLQPNEKKEIGFTIKSDSDGTTETIINVRFKEDNGEEVSISANVILIAGNGDIGSSGDQNYNDNSGGHSSGSESSGSLGSGHYVNSYAVDNSNNNKPSVIAENQANSPTKISLGKKTILGNSVSNAPLFGLSPLLIVLLLLTVLMVVFIVVLLYVRSTRMRRIRIRR